MRADRRVPDVTRAQRSSMVTCGVGLACAAGLYAARAPAQELADAGAQDGSTVHERDLPPRSGSTDATGVDAGTADGATAGDASSRAAATVGDAKPAPARVSDAPTSETVDRALVSEAIDGTTEADTRGLQFYGFMDFTYSKLLVSDDNAWKKSYVGDGSFAVGNLNLYMSSELGSGWRTLAEVRFTYLPLGTDVPDAQGNVLHADTTANDYADFDRPLQWGGIEIERAWIEYSFADWLAITAGQWLTPYGIWNDDHGSPTVIAVQRPFTIGEALFPERQTGLELHGKSFIDATTLGYYLTLSNGRGPVAAYRDYDTNKALGARVFVENRSLLGTFRVGISGYRGKFTDANRHYVVSAGGSGPTVESQTDIVEQYDEVSVAGDLLWDWNALHAQGEIIMNQARFNDAARPVSTGVTGTGFVPDYQRWGAYGLLGYRFSWLGTMPFGMLEYYNFGATTANRQAVPAATAIYLGLNLRPTARVTLKAEYILGVFHGAGELGYGRDNIALGAGQIAWSF